MLGPLKIDLEHFHSFIVTSSKGIYLIQIDNLKEFVAYILNYHDIVKNILWLNKNIHLITSRKAWEILNINVLTEDSIERYLVEKMSVR